MYKQKYSKNTYIFSIILKRNNKKHWSYNLGQNRWKILTPLPPNQGWEIGTFKLPCGVILDFGGGRGGEIIFSNHVTSLFPKKCLYPQVPHSFYFDLVKCSQKVVTSFIPVRYLFYMQKAIGSNKNLRISPEKRILELKNSQKSL